MRATLKTARIRLMSMAVGLVMLPAYAAAQGLPPPLLDEHDFTHCSVVGVFTGVSVHDSDAHPSFGGMVGWPVTGWWALEASAAWSDRPDESSAFGAGITLRRNLRAGQSVMPYVKGGAGVYIATVDSTAPPADFYRRRLRESGEGLPATRQTFTDPAVVLGTGVTWLLGRRFALRPEVEVFIVRGGGRSTAVTSVAAHLEYHFEDMRITR